LVTDVVMPELGGPELAARLARLKPELKTLFLSGYTDSRLANRGLSESDVPFLPKPFEPEELVEQVRELIGPASTPNDTARGLPNTDLEHRRSTATPKMVSTAKIVRLAPAGVRAEGGVQQPRLNDPAMIVEGDVSPMAATGPLSIAESIAPVANAFKDPVVA